MTISHVLLDIEGTTCPVHFVAEQLFPYASQRLEGFIRQHSQEPAVSLLLEAVEQGWQANSNASAQQLWADSQDKDLPLRVVPYLQWLIANDVKFSPLKDLQGMIWHEGYERGEIVAPLFADVAPALRRWRHQGLILGVYSSGSVAAQQLLYQHSSDGDLRDLFSHWFDTRTGAKQQPQSYTAIAKAMGTEAQQVLFVSDSLAELEAAQQVGMTVLFSWRQGNPGQESGSFERISDYSQLNPADDTE